MIKMGENTAEELSTGGQTLQDNMRTTIADDFVATVEKAMDEYIAGINGYSWSSSRFAFDALEKIQKRDFHAKEGKSTINAQEYGWRNGNIKYNQTKTPKAINGWQRLL